MKSKLDSRWNYIAVNGFGYAKAASPAEAMFRLPLGIRSPRVVNYKKCKTGEKEFKQDMLSYEKERSKRLAMISLWKIEKGQAIELDGMLVKNAVAIYVSNSLIESGMSNFVSDCPGSSII